MKRFLPWLVPITVLLIAVPLLLIIKVVAMAKVAGIIMVILTTIALRYWLYRAGKLRSNKGIVKLTANERFFLNKYYPYYKGMSGKELQTFEERIGMILVTYSFDRYDHTDASKEECLLFSTILASVLPVNTPIYKEGKLIVFWKKEGKETSRQGSQQLLFINPDELMQQLDSLKSTPLSANVDSELSKLLIDFHLL